MFHVGILLVMVTAEAGDVVGNRSRWPAADGGARRLLLRFSPQEHTLTTRERHAVVQRRHQRRHQLLLLLLVSSPKAAVAVVRQSAIMHKPILSPDCLCDCVCVFE